MAVSVAACGAGESDEAGEGDPAARIVLNEVVTLEETDECLVEGVRPFVAEWRGGYVMISGIPTARPYRFDAEGRCAGVLGGGEGQGPREFQGVVALASWGDSLYVADPHGGRLSVWGLPEEDPRTVRITPTRFSFTRFTPLGPGRFVVNEGSTPGLDPEMEGHPFHVVDGEGEHRTSFGGDGLHDEDDLTPRIVFPGHRTGRFWSVNPPIRMTQWSEEGERLTHVQPEEPEWLAAPEPPPDFPHPEALPEPHVSWAWSDEDGVLWAIARVPGEDWRDGLMTEGDDVRVRLMDYFDSALLAYDPADGRLLAEARVEGWLHPVHPALPRERPGRVVTAADAGAGSMKVRVLAPRLER